VAIQFDQVIQANELKLCPDMEWNDVNIRSKWGKLCD
jgi:hypothetical protein